MHILHNRHQFGPADEILKLLKPCNKGIKMNCWEALYMNILYKQGLLSLNNKSQIITHYSTWQPSHVTYRLLPLTVVLNSSQPTHTPPGNSRSTSSIIIQVSNFGTTPYKFDIQFHITVQISRCQTPTTHTKHHK